MIAPRHREGRSAQHQGHSADSAVEPQPATPHLLIERTLRWTELFSDWPQPCIASLARAARLRRHARHAMVLSHDRHERELLVVASGLVEISRYGADGRKYLLSFMGPGRVSGLVRLLEATSVGYEYQAHVPSSVIHLPSDAVIAVLDAEPRLWKGVARLGLRRQRDSLENLEQLTLGSTRRRIAATLTSLARQTHTPLRDGQAFTVELSQNDLATMLGVSRQTMNKELRQLAGEAVVDAVYKRITILDAQKLQDIAAQT